MTKLRVVVEGYVFQPRQKCNRGDQLRGRSAPVVPVRLRRWRASSFYGRAWLRGSGQASTARTGLRDVFVAAQEFVSFNLGYDADSSRLVAFGPLDSAETSDLNRSGKGDFMGQCQEDLHGGPAGDRLGEEEVNPAGADIPRLC